MRIISFPGQDRLHAPDEPFSNIPKLLHYIKHLNTGKLTRKGEKMDRTDEIIEEILEHWDEEGDT